LFGIFGIWGLFVRQLADWSLEFGIYLGQLGQLE